MVNSLSPVVFIILVHLYIVLVKFCMIYSYKITVNIVMLLVSGWKQVMRKIVS